MPIVRQAVTAAEPRLSPIRLEVASDLVGRSLVQERIVAILLAAFGALATALACLGVYGLIAYQVVQRTSEIGIRMALGASRRRVLWSTLGRGAGWIATGLVIGVPLSVTAARLARGLVFGLDTANIGALSSAAGLMAVLGLLAAYVPARRASRLDPLRALRHE